MATASRTTVTTSSVVASMVRTRWSGPAPKLTRTRSLVGSRKSRSGVTRRCTTFCSRAHCSTPWTSRRIAAMRVFVNESPRARRSATLGSSTYSRMIANASGPSQRPSTIETSRRWRRPLNNFVSDARWSSACDSSPSGARATSTSTRSVSSRRLPAGVFRVAIRYCVRCRPPSSPTMSKSAVRFVRSDSVVRVESGMAGSGAVERGAGPSYMRE